MKLSDKIRILRKAKGFSQEALGNTLSRVNKDGISRQTISDWENGKCEPKLENIRDLVEVLNVSFNSLLEENIDLDNKETLNLVLKNLDDNCKNNVNSKFRYNIYFYNVRMRDYILLTFYALTILLAIIFSILNHFGIFDDFLATSNLVSFYSIIYLVLISLSPVFFILLIYKIIYIVHGGKRIRIGELNNTHLIINSTSIANNIIYIPIEKIIKIQLCKVKNAKHGSVDILISGKTRPFHLCNIINPQEFINVFDKSAQYINSTDEIKIL